MSNDNNLLLEEFKEFLKSFHYLNPYYYVYCLIIKNESDGRLIKNLFFAVIGGEGILSNDDIYQLVSWTEDLFYYPDRFKSLNKCDAFANRILLARIFIQFLSKRRFQD